MFNLSLQFLVNKNALLYSYICYLHTKQQNQTLILLAFYLLTSFVQCFASLRNVYPLFIPFNVSLFTNFAVLYLRLFARCGNAHH